LLTLVLTPCMLALKARGEERQALKKAHAQQGELVSVK